MRKCLQLDKVSQSASYLIQSLRFFYKQFSTYIDVVLFIKGVIYAPLIIQLFLSYVHSPEGSVKVKY